MQSSSRVDERASGSLTGPAGRVGCGSVNRVTARSSVPQGLESSPSRRKESCMKTTADADEFLALQARELMIYVDELVRRHIVTRLDSTAFETLSRQDAVTIEALGTQGPMLVKDVAALIQLPLSTVSSAVSRLCARRLVRRQTLAADRRNIQLELTSTGAKVYAAMLGAGLRTARTVLDALGPAERSTLLAILQKAMTAERPDC
ncbi:MAG: winged helix-turn-helix transcriptional regulator [Candidatus Rokuibacteriota bacterium]|nr:MAG: winged helix-turn-helix transcriptional regulator [Candidatus Rokubacteria bacterium]